MLFFLSGFRGSSIKCYQKPVHKQNHRLSPLLGHLCESVLVLINDIIAFQILCDIFSKLLKTMLKMSSLFLFFLLLCSNLRFKTCRCLLLSLEVISGWCSLWNKNLSLSVWLWKNKNSAGDSDLIDNSPQHCGSPSLPLLEIFVFLRQNLRKAVISKVTLLNVTFLFSFLDQRWFPGSGWRSSQPFAGELFASLSPCVATVIALTMFWDLSCSLS